MSSCNLSPPKKNLRNGVHLFVIYLRNDTMKMPQVYSFEQYDPKKNILKGHFCRLVDSSWRNLSLHIISSMKIISNLHISCNENLRTHRIRAYPQMLARLISTRRTVWFQDVLCLSPFCSRPTFS